MALVLVGAGTEKTPTIQPLRYFKQRTQYHYCCIYLLSMFTSICLSAAALFTEIIWLTHIRLDLFLIKPPHKMQY